MGVFYKLSKNKIKGSKANGKWYAHLVSTGTMTYRELCRHISEHNSLYGEDVCLGVANKLQSCIVEQLLDGKKVEFGELGTFYLSTQSEGTEQVSGFSAQEHIGKVYLRFAANRKGDYDLTSKALRKRVRLTDINGLVADEALETKKAEEQASAEDGV